MSVASAAAREPTPSRDDSGLRTALRNVPLLPAPANVDDLLARLDAEAEVSSGPLAELISDARYVEPAPEPDDFFAPVSRAANANQRTPLARRLLSGLFGAGLAAGALLIIWNALLKPAPAPPQPAAPAMETVTVGDLPPARALPAVGEPAPEARQDGAPPPETSAERGEPRQTLAPEVTPVLSEPEIEPVSPTPDLALQIETLQGSAPVSIASSALSEPELEPVLPTPDVALQIETIHRSMPASAEPAALPEPLPPAPTLVEAAEPVPPVEAIATPQPVARAAPEPTQETAQTTATFASPGPTEPLRTAPDSPRDADAEAAVAVEARPSVQPSAAEPVASADARVDAAPVSPKPTASPDPMPEVASAAAAPIPAASAATESQPASTEHRTAGIERTVAPALPVRAKARERVPFAGSWAASPEACTPAMQEEGHLVARIGARGARAGDTGCGFKSIRRRGSAWQIAAACSDGETSWRSNVRLFLLQGRLTWESQRGTTVYVRCPRA